MTSIVIAKINICGDRLDLFNTELLLSASLEGVFDSVIAVQARFQHNQVEPLHLLAAVLTEKASQSVKLLQDTGITLEMVLLTLRGATRD